MKNEGNNTEKLQCTECISDYNLNIEGHCINYKSYYIKISQCSSFSYETIRIPKYICEESRIKCFWIPFMGYNIFYFNEVCIKEELNKEYSSEKSFILKTKCTQCKSG